MALQTLWKGVVRLGPHEIPVRLFAAIEDTTVHFRLVHKKDHQPVKQRMVNPETGREVEPERMRKGAEIGRGTFVLLDESDLAGLEPKSSRTIEIQRFIPRSQLDHEWYNRPYYLAPDGDEQKFWALERVLSESGQEGIAHWVMRKKEYVGSLFTHEGRLVLVTLRFADEVVQPSEIQAPDHHKPDQTEIALAEQLVGTLESHFNAPDYHDEFRGRVLELIEAKARGRTIKVKKPRQKAGPTSLADALKASLAGAHSKRRK